MKLFSNAVHSVHKALFSFVALLGIVAGMVLVETASAQAQQALYLYMGVTDDGNAANTGVATSFHCSNFSGATATIQIVVIAQDGTTVVANKSTNTFTAGSTITFSTHPTMVFQDNSAVSNLATGFVGQGAAGILATSVNIACTAMILDAPPPHQAASNYIHYGSIPFPVRRNE